ncbi:MAG: UDP-N-acetylenolpyruvoylglucosamine reductase [Candidatus Parcubacteria bacterium]|nr:UDP-N-acetylenolpyruvoylglucosamine reductase [Candidatus Parcubacteria bacterium]
MKIQENISLGQYTTFQIGGPARFFCNVTTEDELAQAVKFGKKNRLRFFILGGGSNVLISDEGYPGLVIKIELKGVEYKKKGSAVIVSAAAGELWDELVASAVERGLYGIENLSAIPGTVGAAPVQNIGAYGMDVSSSVYKVRAFDRKTMKYVELSNEECCFAYRDSLFLQDRRRYIITRVDFKLTTKGKVNIKYKDVAAYFASRKPPMSEPTLSDVRDAVIDIRWNKLPDWKKWGTAGSFFKNPLVSGRKFKQLQKKYPGIVGYPEPDGRVKVALGWVLDNICEVKGLCHDGAAVYEKQALVIVAKPGAKAGEVVNLAKELMKRVKEKTGIQITGEVEWVN